MTDKMSNTYSVIGRHDMYDHDKDGKWNVHSTHNTLKEAKQALFFGKLKILGGSMYKSMNQVIEYVPEVWADPINNEISVDINGYYTPVYYSFKIRKNN